MKKGLRSFLCVFLASAQCPEPETAPRRRVLVGASLPLVPVQTISYLGVSEDCGVPYLGVLMIRILSRVLY